MGRGPHSVIPRIAMAKAMRHSEPGIAALAAIGLSGRVLVLGIPEVPTQPARVDIGRADVDVDFKGNDGNVNVALVGGETGKLSDEIRRGLFQRSDLAGGG